MVPPIQFPCGSCASRRSSPATANRVFGARVSSARKSARLISLPLRFFIGRPSFCTKAFTSKEKPTAEPTGAVARRSWVPRGVAYCGVNKPLIFGVQPPHLHHREVLGPDHRDEICLRVDPEERGAVSRPAERAGRTRDTRRGVAPYGAPVPESVLTGRPIGAWGGDRSQRGG